MQAGAGAVYFGLTTLNARRRARNFSGRTKSLGPSKPCTWPRRPGVSSRSISICPNANWAKPPASSNWPVKARRGCRVGPRSGPAGPARRVYPELEFHFSTQTCMANSADVAAAGKFGASHASCSRGNFRSPKSSRRVGQCQDVETEVFVQGSAVLLGLRADVCLSSWVGGRSGNRGALHKPLPRAVEHWPDRPAGTPLVDARSGRHVHRLDDLEARPASRALKIEGRLKNAPSGLAVSRSSLYRQASDLSDHSGPTEAERQVSQEELAPPRLPKWAITRAGP